MQPRRIAIMTLIPLILATLACVCGGGLSPLDMFGIDERSMQATLSAIEGIAETAEAEFGDFGDIEATIEAAGDIEATIVAAATEVQIGGESETTLPLPEGAEIIAVTGFETDSEQVIASTSLTIAEIQDFYRDELTSQGLTERTLLTVEGDWGFSMVFDGAPNGLSIVVQVTNISDSERSIVIGLQNV